MNWFWGCSVVGVVKRTNWFSMSRVDKPSTYRAYYGFRIGPFLIVFTRTKVDVLKEEER